ncbi:MAG: SMC family ATPase [Allobranchiibius sp.]
MKLHQLEIQAFGPFAGKQSIDFDALDASGLFLIHGATGAGKTSILDAICYAVYGAVPGSRLGLRETIRSDHAEPDVQPYVLIEFTAAGERLRIRRSPEWVAPKKRGEGTTRRPATVILEVLQSGHWSAQSTRIDEAAEIVSDHLGLGLEQFAQVVLLPQGEFATFLRSKPEDRAALLGRLFDVDRFSRAQSWLAERKRELALRIRMVDSSLGYQTERLTNLLTELDLPPGAVRVPWVDLDGDAPESALSLDSTHLLETIEQFRGLAAEHATLALVEADRTERDRDLARDAAHQGARIAELQEQAQRARATCERFSARSLDRAVETERVQAAGRAAVVQPVAARHLITARDLERAREEADRSAAAACSLLASDRSLETPTHRVQFTQALEAGTVALSGLVALEARHASTTKETEEIAADLRVATTRSSELNCRIAELVKSVDVLRQALEAEPEQADGVGVAQRYVDAAEAAVRTAAGVVETWRAVTESQTVARNARSVFVAAEKAVIDLRSRRLAGIVGELGSQLKADCPCPVCGSADHPSIAAVTLNSVTADEVEEAEAEAVRTRSLQTECESALAAARGRLDERRRAHHLALVSMDASISTPDLPADPGNEDLPDTDAMEAAALAARAALSIANATRQRHAVLVSRSQAAVRALDAARDDRVAAEVDVATATARLHDSEQRCARTADDIAAVLDRHTHECWCDAIDAPRPTERHVRLQQLHRDLQRGDVALQAALVSHDRATADLVDLLASQGFADARASEIAMLDAGRVAQLQAAIADERAGYERALGVLEQPQVIEAEEFAAPDVDDLHAIAQAADHRRTAAAQVVSTADRGVRELHAIETAVREAAAASAADRAELAVLGPLADVAAGSGDNIRRMRLTSYVLAARLEMVTTLANERLSVMSDGRYTLEHTDDLAKSGARSGLGLRVLDAWTGRARDTSSLSGGEAFIASLALALGLGAAVLNDSGGRPLESLFVDEGFGSLDEQTLDQVMSMLDGLRAGGRSVGIVSHVGELRDRIDSRVEIIKTESGSRVVVHAARGSLAV